MMSRLKKWLIRFYVYFPNIGKYRAVRFVFSYLLSIKADEYADHYHPWIIKRLDKYYQKNQYIKYMECFELNKQYLYYKRLSKYFGWAAIIAKGTEQSLNYCCSAVSLNPRIINDVSTAIIYNSYADKKYFNQCLAKVAFNSPAFSPIILTYVLIMEGDYVRLEEILQKEYVQAIFPVNELLESLSLIGDNQAVVELFESSNDPSIVTLEIYEIVYAALTKLNRFDDAQAIFEQADTLFNDTRKCRNKTINPHAINNRLEALFWFQKLDIVKAYATYKRESFSQLLANVFTNKYTQSLSVIISSKNPLILASWGPGDEIRFSQKYNLLHSLNQSVTISCDPRLEKILAERYPCVRFLPVTRIRRVDAVSAHRFNRLPQKSLHHILDNETYQSIENYSHVCLMTDILSDLIEMDELKPNPISYNKNNFSHSRPLKIGVSWSSSIQTASRSEHYFSIEDLRSLFNRSNAEFYSLQYIDSSQDISDIENKFGVKMNVPDIDQYNDFDATLDLMNNLDVILSVGTTVLELSGLSNTPVYALTNSKGYKCRAGRYNNDYWFENIHYVNGFMEMSKSEVVKNIVEDILGESNN